MTGPEGKQLILFPENLYVYIAHKKVDRQRQSSVNIRG